METALGFMPAEDQFGVTVDGEVVELDSLTFITANVTITGYCYVWYAPAFLISAFLVLSTVSQNFLKNKWTCVMKSE